MSTAVIAGASGVVGSRVLELLLERGDVSGVVALGRRELDVTHPKLDSRVVDLQSATALARQMPSDVDLAISCLGTTMKKAGSKAAFRALDRDAVVEIGRAALQKGAKHFLLVSSIGADARSRSTYLQTKGEAEEALARLNYPRLTVLRPSFIDDEGARAESRPLERVGLGASRVVFGLIGRERRYAPISASTIARALVKLALDKSAEGAHTIESNELHRLGVWA